MAAQPKRQPRDWFADHPLLRVYLDKDLDGRIDAAMKQDGEGYRSKYVRKLIELGLRFREMEVGK